MLLSRSYICCIKKIKFIISGSKIGCILPLLHIAIGIYATQGEIHGISAVLTVYTQSNEIECIAVVSTIIIYIAKENITVRIQSPGSICLGIVTDGCLLIAFPIRKIIVIGNLLSVPVVVSSVSMPGDWLTQPCVI